jgi:hypothetical protein
VKAKRYFPYKASVPHIIMMRNWRAKITRRSGRVRGTRTAARRSPTWRPEVVKIEKKGRVDRKRPTMSGVAPKLTAINGRRGRISPTPRSLTNRISEMTTRRLSIERIAHQSLDHHVFPAETDTPT